MRQYTKKFNILLCSTTAMTASAFGQTVEDEVDAETRLDIVTVTALKRISPLEDTPVAIDAFSGETLEYSGVTDLDGLAHVTPSLQINSAGGAAQPFIRGIGSLVNGTGVYGSVATYVDGVYQPRPYALAAGSGDLDFVESVQVLKGPQGTIYGRNATGGAILINTKTPSPGDEMSGFASANLGDFGVQIYSGGVSGGLSDQLAGSLNFSINNSDGFVENLGGGRGLDDTDGFNVVGKLVWEPTDRFQSILKASRTEETANNLPNQQVGQFDNEGAIATFAAFEPLVGFNPAEAFGLNNPQAFYAATLLSFAPALGVDANDPAVFAGIFNAAAGLQFSNDPTGTFANGVNDQTQGIIPGDNIPEDVLSGGFYADTYVSLQLKYGFDSFDLVALGSYDDHTNESVADVFHADPSSIPDLSTIAPAFGLITAPNVSFSATFPSEAYSGEIYAVSKDTAIEWIAGLYYFQEEGNAILSAGAFEFDQLVADNLWDVESISAYGEASFPLTTNLTATAGLRFTEETYDLQDLFMPGTPANAGNLSRSDDQLTYTAKLAYDTGDWLYYAGYSTGFKSGSLNPANPSAGSVAPEEIGSFEVGFKGEVADGRVNLTGAAFLYDYENLQLNILNPINSATFLVDGVEAEITGLELGLDAELTDSTNVTLGATYLDHEFGSDGVIPATNTTPAITSFINGNDLPMTSDLVIAAALNQSFDLSNGSEFLFNANLNYNSGFYVDQDNLFGSGGDENDAFTVVNSSLTYIGKDQRFEASVYVNNLFDEEYYPGGVAAAGGLVQAARIGRPRHFGGIFKVNF